MNMIDSFTSKRVLVSGHSTKQIDCELQMPMNELTEKRIKRCLLSAVA